MKNILLIDDDDATCLILNAILTKNKIVDTFNFCLGGSEALDFLQSCESKNEFPEAIFVDLNMPGMDGYEFIPLYEQQFLQHHPDTKLVVVTSSMRSRDQQQALSYKSVKMFLNKPLTTDKILSVMDR